MESKLHSRKTSIMIYTNIPAPYKFGFWERITNQFPDSCVIFTEKMHKDRPWILPKNNTKFNWKNFYKWLVIPGLGKMSPRLIPWLMRNNKGTIHILGDCGKLNRYLILYFAPIFGGIVIDSNDGAFVEDLTPEYINRYQRRFLKRIPAVFTAGEIGRNYYRRLGFKDNQIFNKYFSNDVDHFSNFEQTLGQEYRKIIRESLNIEPEEFVLLNISRFLNLKRIEDLRDALEILDGDGCKGISLIQIGEGPRRDVIIEMKHKFQNIKVHWIKPMDYLEIPKYYAASDLFVFPSEGDIWGLVVNEALSMGVPVICTDHIGAAELIKEGKNGFTVPIRNPRLIAEKIKALYYDRLKLKNMSEQAKKVCETWNYDFAINELKSLVDLVQSDY